MLSRLSRPKNQSGHNFPYYRVNLSSRGARKVGMFLVYGVFGEGSDRKNRALGFVHMINVLIYSGKTREATEALMRAIQFIVPTEQCRCCFSTVELALCLRQPRSTPVLGILMAGSRNDLAELLAMKDLLRDMELIVILPDRAEETVSMAHGLRPRFLSDNEERGCVAAVMAKMLNKARTWT